MKILLLATVYEYGGLSNVIRNISDNLNRRRFEVVFVVERLAERHYPLRDDIKFIDLGIKPAKGPVRKSLNIFRHLHRIRKTVIDESPDAVLGFGFAINCLFLLSVLWPVKKMPKVILGEYTEHLFVKEKPDSFKEKALNLIYKIIMFFFYHRADVIISVSGSLARHMKRFFLMDARKVKVIHVPVNTEEIRLMFREEIGDRRCENKKPCIGTISRLSMEKGLNYLIEAFYDLLKRLDARLIIVGEGRERGKLENMVRSLGIEDKVDFLGWVENPYKYLKIMDVFVLSSLWEGFPTVLVESMLCGLPVVATRSSGGVEELVKDGVTGLLTPPKDIRILSDSLYNLLQNKELRNRMSLEGAKEVRRFDALKVTSEYESLMLGLLK